MSLRDRFRSLGGSQEDGGAGPDGDGPPEPIDFRPRFDGGYADGTGIVLRFTPSHVSEIADGADGPQGAAGGEYTPSGRFVVQRRFARPIVYAVLAAGTDGFAARRTDTNPGGGTAEVAFTFRPSVTGVDADGCPRHDDPSTWSGYLRAVGGSRPAGGGPRIRRADPKESRGACSPRPRPPPGPTRVRVRGQDTALGRRGAWEYLHRGGRGFMVFVDAECLRRRSQRDIRRVTDR